MTGSIEKRRAKVEASRMGGALTLVCSGVPLAPGEAESLLANAPGLIAEGRAIAMGQILVMHRPRLTREEWLAKRTSS